MMAILRLPTILSHSIQSMGPELLAVGGGSLKSSKNEMVLWPA